MGWSALLLDSIGGLKEQLLVVQLLIAGLAGPGWIGPTLEVMTLDC